MKKIKVVLIVFLITCVSSLMNVKAGYLVMSSITIPSFKGYFTSDEAVKETYSNQYMKKIGAVDKLSGDGRAILGCISGVSGGFTDLVDNEFTILENSPSGYGQIPATYRLLLQSKKWLVTEAYFTGNWVLDENILN